MSHTNHSVGRGRTVLSATAAGLFVATGLATTWAQALPQRAETIDPAAVSVLTFDVADAEENCAGGVCTMPGLTQAESCTDCTEHDDAVFGDATPVADPLCQALAPPASTARSSRAYDWRQWTRDPLLTAMLSLGFVVVSYFVLRLFWRARGMKSSGRMPAQVIEIVGQVPLGPRHQLQLVRLATRLVLVSVNPQGATTLAEITDSVEVEQIMEACEAGGPTLAGALDRLSRRAQVRSERGLAPRSTPRAVFEA